MIHPGRLSAGMLALCFVLGSGRSASAQDPRPDDRETLPVQPDFQVINIPTNLRLPRHAMAFALTHRFSRPLGEGDFGDLVADFFAFDSGAQVGLGLRFGLFTGTEVAVYRTNDRAIQFSAKHDLKQQQGTRGLSLGLMGTVEGRNNFGEQYAPAIAFVASRKLGQRAALYAVPVFVANAAVDPDQHDDDALLLGLGARVLIGHGMALVAEWTPRLAGYDPLDPLDPRQQAGQAVSFAFEKRVGGHAFQLNFSNTFATTFASLARGATKTGWFIGFNLSRKFY